MYGDKRNYKKINFYDKKTGKYLCSTTWARTCREAIEYYNRHILKDDKDSGVVLATYK